MTRDELGQWQARYLGALVSKEPGRRAELRAEVGEASDAVLDGIRRSFYRSLLRSVEGYFPVFARLCPELPQRLVEAFAEVGTCCDRGALIDRAHRRLGEVVRGRPHGSVLVELLHVERAVALASFHRVTARAGDSGSAHVHRVELHTNVMTLYPRIDRLEDVEAGPPVAYEIYFAGEADDVVARRLRAPAEPNPTGGRP